MINVSVQLTSINAERLAETLPPKLNFNINLALPSDQPYTQANRFIIPFTFTVNTLPPVVTITLKGRAIVMSDKTDELRKIEKDVKNKKVPPPLIQAVFTNMIAESILLSRSLGTPPPLPGLPGMQQVKPGKKPGEPGPGPII